VDASNSIIASSALLKQIKALPATSAPVLLHSVSDDYPAILGFSRTARNESPALSIYCAQSSALESMLFYLSKTNFKGEEFEMYEGARIPRLSVSDITAAPTAASTEEKETKVIQHYRLDVLHPGQLESLTFVEIPSEDGLAPNEVRITTKAIAVHFKDVMLAMNMLPGFDPILGLECSGHVSAVGTEAAKSLSVGDPVLVVSMSVKNRSSRNSMMASTFVCDMHEVVKAPTNVDLSVSAGFLGVMATAYYCLVTQARGESNISIICFCAHVPSTFEHRLLLYFLIFFFQFKKTSGS